MADKAAKVTELVERFQSSTTVVLTEYRGLTVSQLKEFRRSISADATYAVAKNTLLTIAAKQAGVTAFDGQLVGPSAMVFVTGDPVNVAKSIRDFAKANPLLVVKSGIMDGALLSASDITKLADLESREVLLSKAAGVLKASLFKAAYTFNAPLSQAVRTIDAQRQKLESGN